MAVTETVVLPAQPATGLVDYIPLGGNGYNAPMSAYSFQVTLASDASAGTNSITLEMDPQFLSLISYLQVTVSGASASMANRIDIGATTFDVIYDTALVFWDDATDVASKLWKPPAAMVTQQNANYQPFVKSHLLNVDGETHFFIGRIYNFAKRARETTPLSVLLANLPR